VGSRKRQYLLFRACSGPVLDFSASRKEFSRKPDGKRAKTTSFGAGKIFFLVEKNTGSGPNFFCECFRERNNQNLLPAARKRHLGGVCWGLFTSAESRPLGVHKAQTFPARTWQGMGEQRPIWVAVAPDAAKKRAYDPVTEGVLFLSTPHPPVVWNRPTFVHCFQNYSPPGR